MICDHLNSFAPFFMFNGIFSLYDTGVCGQIDSFVTCIPTMPSTETAFTLLAWFLWQSFHQLLFVAVFTVLQDTFFKRPPLSSKSVLSSEVRICIHLFIQQTSAFFYLYWFSVPFFLWLPRILELNFVYSYSSICLAQLNYEVHKFIIV